MLKSILATICLSLLLLVDNAHPVVAISPNAVVPGQFIITYKLHQDPQTLEHPNEQALEKSLGLQKKKALNSSIQNENLKKIYLIQLNKQYDFNTVKQKYTSLPHIDSIEPNVKLKASSLPQDTFTQNQWNLQATNLPQAWDITQGSTDIKVAIPDTGVYFFHPDLINTPIVKGSDFINLDADPLDDNNHGTNVAGIIGATTNNQIGISSIAWNTTLIIQKILDSQGNGDIALLVEAIDEAVNLGARVINLSMGNPATVSAPCSSQTALQSMITYANQVGVSIVASAGNENADAQTVTPASCEGVITAGAYNQAGVRALFSNYGAVVDIAAPGENIYTLNPPDAYGAGYGTSFSTPHVSGVIVLMLAVNPTLTPGQITQILKDSATPLTTDQPIGGKLNAQAAVQAAAIALTPAPNPADLNLSGFVDYLDIIHLIQNFLQYNIFTFNTIVSNFST